MGGSEPAFRLGENAGALFVVSTDYSNNFFGGDLIGQPEPAILIDEDAASSTSLAGAPVEGVKEEVIDPNLDLFIPEAASPIHRLTVLRESAGDDFNLERIAQLPSEAQPAPIGKPGEDIYSVRLLGDRGYIVTFQKTDPLYVLDLSNPEDPRVTGELVIDGYSDYLHPVGDDLLIGVGKDSVNDGRTAWYQGIKIALFDVSDPSNPAEITSKIVGSRGSETPVSYDHKAFSFLNMGSGQYRMVLPIQVNDGVQDQPWEWTNWSHTGLHLYDVSVPDNASDAEFTAAGVIIASQTSDTQNWNDYVQTQRGIIDGDAVHYVYGNEVISADWNDPVNTATQRQ